MVQDTNLAVRAELFRNSLPELAFRKVAVADASLLSPAMRVELVDVFVRPKFDRYLGRRGRLAFLGEYFSRSIAIYPTIAVTECVDVKDNMILECALAGLADLIITGDDHLLRLNPWRGIQILKPADYLALP